MMDKRTKNTGVEWIALESLVSMNERLSHEVYEEWEDLYHSPITPSWYEALLLHKWQWYVMQN